MVRAWTLGYRPVYEKAVRVPGNAKAPGGYAFRTREEAEAYRLKHYLGKDYQSWAMELPGTFKECATKNFAATAVARHAWHSEATPYMKECGVCEPRVIPRLECHLLLVSAPFIHPDHDAVVSDLTSDDVASLPGPTFEPGPTVPSAEDPADG